ncbi:MAG: hypothetical protein IKL84_04090 [Clostridia bacterium]|nr:hypothetical protein [Clostridia bacterium]
MRKILALTMALLMTLSFIACAADVDTPPAGNDTTAPQETEAPETTLPPETEPQLELPDVGDKYKGTELVILDRGNEVSSYKEPWIYAEAPNGDTINDSVFKRNSYLEEKYGIKIVEVVAPGGKVPDALATASQAQEDLYDIAFPRAMYGGPQILQGMYYNLYDLPYADFDKPWWDGDNMKKNSYQGKSYWTISDISLAAMASCHGIIFNRAVADKYNIELPYDIVKRNEWTLDKFFQLAHQVSTDDGDGVWGYNDVYGFGSDIRNAMLGTVNTLVVAAGVDIFTLNSENKLVNSFMNEATMNILDTLRTNLNDKSVKAYQDLEPDPDGLKSYNLQRKTFSEGHYLFIQGNVRYFDYFIGYNMEDEYGIVPMPKLTADQESYHHVPDRNSTGLVVPCTNDPADLERISILVEDMAYMSSKTILPDYYEVIIALRRARVPELAEMVDIIKNTMSYDLSFIHTIGHTDCLHNAFVSGDYASTFESHRGTIDTKLEELYTSLQALN